MAFETKFTYRRAREVLLLPLEVIASICIALAACVCCPCFCCCACRHDGF